MSGDETLRSQQQSRDLATVAESAEGVLNAAAAGSLRESGFFDGEGSESDRDDAGETGRAATAADSIAGAVRPAIAVSAASATAAVFSGQAIGFVAGPTSIAIRAKTIRSSRRRRRNFERRLKGVRKTFTMQNVAAND